MSSWLDVFHLVILNYSVSSNNLKLLIFDAWDIISKIAGKGSSNWKSVYSITSLRKKKHNCLKATCLMIHESKSMSMHVKCQDLEISR